MESFFLKNKRILFICQKFYDYHEKILTQLQESGAEVTFYENKMFREDPALHPNEVLSNILRTFNPNYKHKYANHILSETVDVKFDILLCVGGGAITNDFVNKLKQRNREIKTIIYFWDSFKTWPFQFLISAFDKVYSFDRQDCEKYNINYFPLFYSEDNIDLVSYSKRDIDILYVGSVNPVSINRFKILATICKLCEQNNFSSFLYLFSPLLSNNNFIKVVNVVRKLVDSNHRRFISTLYDYRTKYNFVFNVPLNSKQLKSYLYRAKCVIDITVPGQIGLTMRSIETLHMGCKLITTNSSIIHEEFFNNKWIKVVQDDMEFDKEFVQTEPDSPIYIDNLSLKNWLKKIINE